jgi:hypothetical protein
MPTAALEGAQKVPWRNGEIIRQAMSEMEDAVMVVPSAQSP